MSCSLVPPIAASMFNKEAIGEDFYFDENLITCPDYDFWIRVGGRFSASQFSVCDKILASSRGDRTSMSYRPEVHLQFAKDKISSLSDYLQTHVRAPTLRLRLFDDFRKGVYCWAGEMVYSLEGDSQTFFQICALAMAAGPIDDRVQGLINRSPELKNWAKDPTRPFPDPIPSAPPPASITQLKRFDLSKFLVSDDWQSKISSSAGGVTIRGGPSAWGYSWQLKLDEFEFPSTLGRLWLRIDCQVLSGSVGVSLLEYDSICFEQVLPAGLGPQTAYLRVTELETGSRLLIRNAGEAGSTISVASVFVVTDRSISLPVARA